MSTSFGVIPKHIGPKVTFGNVTSLAEKSIEEFLQSYQLDVKIKISVEVRDNDDKYVNQVGLDDRFLWKDSEHAFFIIDKAKGGTDAYCNKLSDTTEYWADFVEQKCGNLATAAEIAEIKKNDVKWYFRRSAGQSALINIVYGHLAGALAELSDGIIHSDTGWDPAIFPCKTEDFLKVYFRPEKTEHEPSRKWSEKSLNNLRESVAGRKAML